MKNIYNIKILILCFVLFLASTLNAAVYTVNAGSYYYTPSSLNINIGDTVEWINDGGTHDVNANIDSQTGISFNNPVSFQSNPTSTVGSVIYTHVFTVAGTYSYDCSIGSHAAAGMVGSITVSSSNTIYDIVSNSNDHATLKVAIDACGLDVTLSSSGPFTLFAPTDAAFNLLPTGTVASLLNDIPQLTSILLHHVVQGSVMSNMLSNNQVVTTVNGTNLLVTINSSGVFIDNALVTVTDIVADNGVVHVIDAVLLPPADCAGIINGISATDACGTCHQSYMYAGMGSLTYVDTYSDTIGLSGTFILAGSPIDVMSNPNWISDSSLCSNSIYDIVANSNDHTTLKSAIDACSLDGTLSDPGPFTLFAPTDAAFNLLPTGTLTALLNDIPALTNILLHHVVGDSVMSTMLSNNQIVTTLLGTDVTVTINSSGVFIDNAMVTVGDIVADNGVVHVIDAVLIPTAPTIYDIVSNSTNHTTLKTAIDACSLVGTLSGPGPFTLFAPTDDAFNLLPAGTVTALLNDIPALTNILLHHVVGDSVMSTMLSNGQIVTTLNGTDVAVTINSTGVFVDNAQVSVTDIVANNGVVHVIDAVLLPSTASLSNVTPNSNPDFLYSINILGAKIQEYSKNQIVFDVYNDGSIVKRFIK